MRIEDFVLAAQRHSGAGLSRAYLVACVERLELPDELVAAHTRFSTDAYARNLVLRTPSFELLVLCWRPGQRSTIHDHGGSVGVVRVYRGELTSRLYAAGDGLPARRIDEVVAGPGAHAAVDRPDIHQLANESAEDLVTIHVYSPPLRELSVFSTERPGSEKVRLRYSLHDDLD